MLRSEANRVMWVGWAAALTIGLAVTVALILALAAEPAHAASITVTSSNNSGSGSLREAISSANTNPGVDAIQFNIPGGGPHTISLTSELPEITDSVTIDGYTQPGASPNNLEQGTNAVLKIVLNGSAAGSSSGLKISASNSTVRGLVINGFGGGGIVLGNFSCTSGDNNVIEGNFIGTNPDGSAAGPGNGIAGVSICSKNNTIGGTTPAARNLISGNTAPGISINNFADTTQGNRIEGNLIGTNAAGTSAVPNFAGVFVGARAGGNTIGGTAAGARNVISGNSSDGVLLGGDTFNTAPGDTIRGNYIGTDATGNAALPNAENGVRITLPNKNNTIGGTAAGVGNVISGNARNGIAIESEGNTIQGNLIGVRQNGTGSLGNGQPSVNAGSGVLVHASNNTVGGTDAGAANVIANSVLAGVILTGQHSEGTAVLSNSIFSNGRLGIDLIDGGPMGVTTNDNDDIDNSPANNGQNFPVISSASISGGNVTVSGTLNSNPNSTFRLEFFANGSCNAAVSGFPAEQFFGEGQTFVGATNVATDSNGDGTFGPLSFPVPAGQSVITATASNTSGTAPNTRVGDTSEFSECRTATTGNAAPTAANDSYTTTQDTPLNQPAPGVLANDNDANGDTLTALTVSNPTNGALTLNPNGSFTYIPSAGFTGSDSFTYKANDSQADSNTATVTINVQPQANPPAIAINDVKIKEGNAGTKNAVFTVRLDDLPAQQVAVNFATANGKAKAPKDYTATSGTLTFDELTEKISVPIRGDRRDEPNETFFVNLSGATNASLADNQGRASIKDND